MRNPNREMKMSPTMRRAARRRIVPLLVVLAGACQTWKMETGPVPEALNANPLPNHIRVAMADGRKLELEVPRLAGDSVRGFVGDGKLAAVPVDGVVKLERRETNGGGTAAAVVGLGATVALLAVVAQGLSEWSFEE
jgi:hypothetical protein